MVAVTATQDWHLTFPEAHIGLLEVSGVDNAPQATGLDEEKRQVEELLRQRYAGFSRGDFLALPVMRAYNAYYKKFDKTYHVLLQLESVVLKGKNLPNVSPLVDANFTAELYTLVLTAGHDVTCLQKPVCIDVTRQGETFIQMGGALKELRAGDMVMRDSQGIACTILYGQDSRSPITLATTHALYVAYAPQGVGEANVVAQLEAILKNIRLFAPGCCVEQLTVLRG